MDSTQLLKGVLDAVVLAVIETEDGYGYDVVRRLRGAGLTDIADASVYGTLRRLFQAGALTSYVAPSADGPHRKYYGLTPVGAELLQQSRASWKNFNQTVTGIFEGSRSAA
jgi:PadR family transcriptional regulator PadR